MGKNVPRPGQVYSGTMKRPGMSRSCFLFFQYRNRIGLLSKFLKRYSKPSAPGHQLIHERCDESKGVFQRGSREAQVRFPEYQKGTE